MNILEQLVQKGKLSDITVAIGLAKSVNDNRNINKAIVRFFHSYSNNIILYGTHDTIKQFLEKSSLSKYKSKLKFKETPNPEQEVLADLKSNKLGAVIRGSFKSDLFIKQIKKDWNILETNRLALLESFKKYKFFFGPVGIDECNSLQSKILFIESAIRQINALKITPRISVLSGGRISDIGRDPLVDQSIEDAKTIIAHFNEKYPLLNIKHDEILIENAINNESNLIIAPNGISGNLIYRTLVHLGGGKAYGAIYMNIDKVIIDTSRVGAPSEIIGAVIMAKALTIRD